MHFTIPGSYIQEISEHQASLSLTQASISFQDGGELRAADFAVFNAMAESLEQYYTSQRIIALKSGVHEINARPRNGH